MNACCSLHRIHDSTPRQRQLTASRQVDLYGVYWFRVPKRFAMKLAFRNTRKLTRIEAQAIKEVLLERNRITQEVGEASS